MKLMQPDLKKIPFGQYMSRHLLFEEWDPKGKGYTKGLYLALASETSSMFGGVVERSAGMIKLEPTLNGEKLEVTAQATEAEAVLSCGGKELRMAIDKNALLLESSGLGLCMQVRLGHGETASVFENGYVLNMGATRYIIEMKKGKAELQVMWDLTALHSTDPVITLTPENGELEAVFWDTDSSLAKGQIAENVSAAAEKAAKAFAAFRESTCGDNELYDYILWIGYMKLRGQNLLISNKLADVRAVGRGQLLAALAYKKPEPVVESLLSLFELMTPGGIVPAWAKASAVLPEAAPPLWGLALTRVLENGGVKEVSSEKLEALYAQVKKATEWWYANRSVNGACFYAYACESGWAGKMTITDSAPQIYPDLCAWMYLNCKALAIIAEGLGLKTDAGEWKKKAAVQLDTLRSLWKNDAFVIRNAVTGEEKPCPADNALMTLALSSELPEGIAPKGETAGIPAYIAALGCAERAKTLKNAKIEAENVPSAAVYNPELCALAAALEKGAE